MLRCVTRMAFAMGLAMGLATSSAGAVEAGHALPPAGEMMHVGGEVLALRNVLLISAAPAECR
jgi:hypothetical protein